MTKEELIGQLQGLPDGCEVKIMVSMGRMALHYDIWKVMVQSNTDGSQSIGLIVRGKCAEVEDKDE